MPTKPANPITYAEWNSLASLSDKLLMVNTSHDPPPLCTVYATVHKLYFFFFFSVSLIDIILRKVGRYFVIVSPHLQPYWIISPCYLYQMVK